jgi:transcriptional regulator with XRE-family HTH domain
LQVLKSGRTKKGPDPVDVLVGQCIRMHRLTRGMSQTALATELGLTFQQVQKYERGANRVGAGRLVRIAEILEVPVQLLFRDVLSNAKKLADEASPLEWLSEPGTMRLIQAYRRVRKPHLRRAIVNLVEQMISE